MIRILIIGVLLFMQGVVFGQESKLAQNYYNNGEYEKAAVLYQKLYKKHAYNDYYFRYYYNSLLNLGEYKNCEKIIKDAIKKKPQDLFLLVRQGTLYEKLDQQDKAEKLYEKAIKKLKNDRNQVIRLASAFSQLTKYEYALNVYEKGIKLIGDETIFSSSLAELYRRKGDIEQMIKYYLIYSKKNANSLKYVKQILQREYSDSLSLVLKNQLYENIQKDPEETTYIKLLGWVFIQNKEYSKALRQLISLDKRLEEDGKQVFEIAQIAEKDKDYNTAIKAYQYISEEKNLNNSYLLQSERNLLICMKNKLKDEGNLTEQELLNIKNKYIKTLDKLGVNNRTAYISIEYANFEAIYMNHLDPAIKILSELISRAGLNDRIKAKAKLDLGDYYLMSGEIWEGSLLYSQVDKDFQEGFLGEIARFKNAKLSYYNGDFEWSKIQLDVLKSATSKLISNDAIELSVFISENIGLDSTTIPLKMYANSELLAYQHKYDESFANLDSIAFLYPNHELEDDIWYLKAHLYLGLKDYENTVIYYKKIIDNHAEDIRGDNAMFELAQLYENILNKPEKANEIYEKIFIDYSNSTFAIEARKSYRALSEQTKFMRGIND